MENHELKPITRFH